MKKQNRKKGFTIIELVIVIAVIAILAAVMIPTFSNVISRANESKALQSAKNAYTDYLAEGNNALETNHNLLIDTGDYVLLVENNSLKVDSVKEAEPTAVTITTTSYELASSYESGQAYYTKGDNETYTAASVGDENTFKSGTYYKQGTAVDSKEGKYVTYGEKTTYYVLEGTYEGCTIYSTYTLAGNQVEKA